MKLAIKFFIISLVVFVVGLTGIFEPLRNLSHALTNPIQYGLYIAKLSFTDAFSFFTKLKTIRSENLQLSEEKEKLLSQISALTEVKNENMLLKTQLGLNKTIEGQKLVLAYVVGLPYANENSEVMINKGKTDGIQVGFPVIYKNFLVGSVVDVFDYRSVVVLITSPKLSVAALDQTSGSRAKGLVTGNFGTALIMDRILQDEVIAAGDLIVTSGEDGIFESGLILGKVVEVSESQSEPLKKAILTTLLHLTKLESMFVVISKDK